METKQVKIFLDDYRVPTDCLGYMYTRIGNLNPIYSEEWIVVKNYNEFVKAVQENYPNISHISFDHDLADEHYSPAMVHDDDYNDLAETFTERTGLDCAKWLKDYYEADPETSLPVLFVHSMNPVGTKNIINLFKHE